jgi:RNA-binding protein
MSKGAGGDKDAKVDRGAKVDGESLKGRDRRSLRSRGSTLPASFVIGKGGLTIGGHNKVAELLQANELVKVRVLPTSPVSADEASEQLARQAGAEVVQVLGNTILLFRKKT